MHYRISKKPCKDGKTGFYYYRRSVIDPESRTAIQKPERISLSTRNLRDAKEKLVKVQEDLHSLSVKNQSRVIWSEFRRTFEESELARIRYGFIKIRSHNENTRYLQKFEDFLQKTFHTTQVYLSQIRREHARQFLDSMHGRLPSQSGLRSRQYARNLLIRAFDVAVDEEKLDSNPFFKSPNLPVPHKEPNPFTVEELSSLVSCLPQSNYEYRTWRNGIRFTYGTGLRNSELRNLRVKDLKSDDEGTFAFCATTKNGHDHRIPLTGEAYDAFADQMQNLRDQFGSEASGNLPLFAGIKGGVLSSATVSKWISKAIRYHAPHLKGKTFHGLRKTTLTEVEERDGLLAASHVANHANTAVTARHYVRRKVPALHDLRESLEKLPRLEAPMVQSSIPNTPRQL